MRQKLLQKKLVTQEDYQLCRVDLRNCLESTLGDKDESELTLLEIAVNEALNNSFRHGRVKGKANSVCFSMTLFKAKRDSECLLVRVKDCGVGFRVEGVRKHLHEKSACPKEETLKDSGRGMLIMESVMDQVRYSAKGNSVVMVKRI